MSSRWLSPRSLALHAGVLSWLAVCVLAAIWQFARASQGNAYSYVYAIEWPGFAAVSLWVWWKSMHRDPEPDTPARRSLRELEEMRVAREHLAMRDREHEDPELAAYNDHLAELATSGRRKNWRR